MLVFTHPALVVRLPIYTYPLGGGFLYRVMDYDADIGARLELTTYIHARSCNLELVFEKLLDAYCGNYVVA